MKKDPKKKRKHALKGFSVFFAFFLWLYVLSSAQTKGEKIVKLSYKAPTGYAVKNQPVKEITYAIRGPRVFVRALMQKSDTLTVDLEKIFVENKNQYEINVNDLGMSFPFGVDLTRVEPNRVVVRLEKALVKEARIKLNTTGEVPSDHKMITSSIEPKKVMIEGPASIVRKIDRIETAPIELNGLTGSGKIMAFLSRPDDRVSLSQKEVEYQYTIQPTRANLILKNVPVKFLSSQLVKAANRRSVNLMVLADNEEKLEYGKKDIEVVADIPESAKGKIKVELKAKLPAGLHLLEIQPPFLEVEVEEMSYE
ncbi:MAG: CdaR family protein [Bacteriovoracaceae bacterium]